MATPAPPKINAEWDTFCIYFLSKSQTWHIIDARSAAYIIKVGLPTLYLITRQRASICDLMIYSPESEIFSFFGRMIYSFCETDDIQGLRLDFS